MEDKLLKERRRIAIVRAMNAIGHNYPNSIVLSTIRDIGQDRCDKIIKSGKIIQNIGGNSRTNFNNAPFFAAINKHDKKTYYMSFPYQKRMMIDWIGAKYNGIYKNDIEITKDIKRASVSNARKILYDKMNNDANFKNKTIEAMKNTSFGKDAERLFEKKPKKFYANFNRALGTPSFQSKGIHKDFYSALEKKGYNALLDMNDARYSLYRPLVKDPTIFFGKGMFKKIGVTKISDAEIDENVVKYTKKMLRRSNVIGLKIP